MFGLTFEKILLIGIIAMILIGPTQLPRYAAALAKIAKVVRNLVDGAKERVRDEMGPEFDEVDWKRLDPRQYDPRSIIRDALLTDDRPRVPAHPSPLGTTPTPDTILDTGPSQATPNNSAPEDPMYR